MPSNFTDSLDMQPVNCKAFTLILLFCLLGACLGGSWCLELRFPSGFKFGAASSAYQVEGAWNVSDKAESIWDHMIHREPVKIFNKSNGDVACDSYSKYKEDVKLCADLGLHYYRFSISWTRLLPTENHVSEDGKTYYNNLIDELLSNGIEPVVTLYHWDLPQYYQDLGGWTNPLIAEWFTHYARVAFTLFGDRVNTWITINEPIVVCDLSYNTGVLAPGILSPDFGNLLCTKNILLAHAKAWRLYDEEFRSLYNGKISLCNHVVWAEAMDADDEELAELVREHSIGRFSHPIFSREGGWPSDLQMIIDEKSKREHLPMSRLPYFTKEEIALLKGTFDFYGLNMYTSRLVRKMKPNEKLFSTPMTGVNDLGAALIPHPDWKAAGPEWFYVYPEGLRKTLVWLKKKYGNIEFFITENGCGSTASDYNDDYRIEFYTKHMEQVLLAMNEDGVNVSGYTAWTLIDNFEWSDGYRYKFGFYNVDFSSTNRTRTPRKSAHFYKELIMKNNF